jgi:RNA polymerase sigma-70 factor (ECF subfamily)
MGDEATIHLVARWRNGDQEAASQLFERYAHRLAALVRGRLSARFAQRLDAEDVVQSAYRSFFGAVREGRFAIERGGDLWRLLVVMALHKLQHQVRHNSAEKRAVVREQNDVPHDQRLVDLIAHDPSPIEAVALTDQLEEVMRQLDPLHRRMLELRLQGHDWAEIAAATQRTQRTVRRVLERVKERLQP